MLDDHERGRPAVGEPFIVQASKLGIPTSSRVHKGSPASGGSRFASPVDIGPAAAAHPDANFVVYHSGFEGRARFEGPYDGATEAWASNRLIASLERGGHRPERERVRRARHDVVEPDARPDAGRARARQAAEAFGEDNVVWGTDSIWYGSPQDQIQAFRAFEISPEFQERYGYPALTRS